MINRFDKMSNKVVVIITLVVIVVAIIIFTVVTDFIDEKEYQKNIEDVLEDISFNVPDDFEENYPNSYSYSDDSVYCDLYIFDSDKYMDLNEWFATMVSVNLNEELTKKTKVTIDGQEAPFVEIVSENSIDHYYGLETKDNNLLINYSITDYLKGDRGNTDNLCYTAEEEIISSIKVKK